MLTSITPLLTLAAFTMHAVLGCCWHHSHAASDGGCEHPAGHAVVECCSSSDLHSPIEHGDDSAAHVHCDSQFDCDSQFVCDSRASQVAVQHVEDACYSDSPCEHSHDCNGARCCYLRIGSASINLTVTQPCGWMACLDVSVNDLRGPFQRTGDRFAEPFAVPFCTAPQTCAVLQSWQI